MSKPTTKEYSDKNVTVVWKPNLCIHSEKCFHGLPEVFNPDARPWINMEGADNEQIVSQVKNCPSGALSFYYNDDTKKEEEATSAGAAKVEFFKNGPMIVHGTVNLKLPDGREEQKTGATALCRCGASANKPFCDGTHKKVEFEG